MDFLKIVVGLIIWNGGALLLQEAVPAESRWLFWMAIMAGNAGAAFSMARLFRLF